jgi:AraC family transcriptional activator FtrA
LVSICSGVFVLAATGLLDGKSATTHWRYADTLQALYPNIKVNPDILYSDNGSVLTSAGSAAGLDLCMHIIRKDYGVHVANAVARRLVIPPHREGGQAQFVSAPVGEEQLPWLSNLAWIDANLAKQITVEQLAAKAHMSLRTFSRKFQGAVGTSPGDWLIARRIQAAKDLPEATSDSVEMVAERCGFSSAAIFRQHFAKRVKTTPRAYRLNFGAMPATLESGA